jgi:heme-degrading monooxygenase HmoA
VIEMGNGIERHVTFHILPDDVEDFEIFFEQEYRPAMEKTSGFVKAELLKDLENPHDLKMVLRFKTSDTAADWRASEAHTALKPRLKSMYSSSDLKVYEVIA